MGCWLAWNKQDDTIRDPQFQDKTTISYMVEAHTNSEMVFRKWQQLKISRSQVWEELKDRELSAEEIASVWENYSRYRIARRITQGWLWMGIGGFLGLVSCVLTMLDPLPDFRGVFIYGFTSIAVSMALYGCYLVMEKPNDEEG